MLTDRWSIVPMQYVGLNPSGTVRWSALLPVSNRAEITLTGSGLEGSVRQVPPVRYASRRDVAGVAR